MNTADRKYRVVQVGTGLTGREALRAIINDPALELVGVQVSSPDKVGVDPGRLCGVADVGVLLGPLVVTRQCAGDRVR